MDPAVIGAVAAIAGVLLGHLLTRSGEYRKWLRVERHRVSAELLAAGEAIRRHSAARILAAYDGDLADEEPSTHLVDLERLELALEAYETVVPGRIAALAREFGAAATSLVHHSGKGPKSGENPGERYLAARARLTDEARLMIAPTVRDRLRGLRRRPSSGAPQTPARRLHGSEV